MPLDFISERQRSGRQNYLDGLAAEDNAEIALRFRGYSILESRWRCGEGEIDLICKDGDEYVFVEVKKAATHDAAAERLTPQKIARITGAANSYMAQQPGGMLAFWRVDAALVDDKGQVEILTNITI